MSSKISTIMAHFLNAIHKKNNQGLTVAEFLVAAGVIIFLATLVIVFVVLRVQSYQAANRDTEREIHVKQLVQALTFYQSNVGNYPYPADGEVIDGSDDLLSRSLKDTRILSQIPLDPLNKGNYRYKYTSGNGSSFVIEYYMETDAVSGKTQGLNRAYP
ncbi:TPA: hypothetical protein DCY68_01690 [Candidatus Azambacteria bacterium]|nr:hypothetical protein [Candidatus Azambacteria bacterium]HBC59010.1 hypothetical protein [Candidatus Azambacteria bacterium]HCB36035.1 hypothetical protein [Candidatus Azambacteria bacterium]